MPQPKLPPHFLIVVPGFMGSKLREPGANAIAWGDFARLFAHPFATESAADAFYQRLSNPIELEPDGLLDEVLFAPPLIKQERYGYLLDVLRALGYQIDPAVDQDAALAAYTFAYDWRQDMRRSAQLLSQAIEMWRQRKPGLAPWLLACGSGGLITRWYRDHLAGSAAGSRFLQLGSLTPNGPALLTSIQNGLESFIAPSLAGGDQSKSLLRSWPSIYQLLAWAAPALWDESGRPLDFFSASGWFPTDQEQLLLWAGQQFASATGDSDDHDDTPALPRQQGIRPVEWTGSQSKHVPALDELPTDPDTIQQLVWELRNSYLEVEAHRPRRDRLGIELAADRDRYAQGEPIGITAAVWEVESETPIFAAHAGVQLAWRGSVEEPWQTAPASLPETLLEESAPGRYYGECQAPYAAGYYQLRLTVRANGVPAIRRDAWIWVEGFRPTAAMPEAFTSVVFDKPNNDLASPGGDNAPHARGASADTASEAAPKSVVSPADAPTLDEEARVFKGELRGCDLSRPLEVGRKYPLVFSVDFLSQAGPIAVDVGNLAAEFTGAEEWIELLVHLSASPDEFAMDDPRPQRLIVPRRGPSYNQASFVIQPLRVGVAEIKAYFLRANNYVQGMAIGFNVGAGAGAVRDVAVAGRAATDGAAPVQPRNLNLRISNEGNGYAFALTGVEERQAFLRISSEGMNDLVTKVRQTFEEIVFLARRSNGQLEVAAPEEEAEFYYQQAIDIPLDVHQEAMVRLARTGWFLFDQLFFSGPWTDDATAALGAALQAAALGATTPLHIQITSQDLMLPWGVFYLGDAAPADAAAVDSNNFLGYRHVLEHIPATQSSQATKTALPSANLAVSLNLNDDIDAETATKLVARQEEYWRALAAGATGIALEVRNTDQEILAGLKKEPLADQIMYFYCHAEAEGRGGAGGWYKSALRFGGGKSLTMEQLSMEAPARHKLAGAPLIFLNACESAQLSPLFYMGFMPYFVKRGARGVIGTECRTPALFAAAWARRFFGEFLTSGKSVGEIFLQLRREYLEQHNNLLGILYALYCDGDLHLEPPLVVPDVSQIELF